MAVSAGESAAAGKARRFGIEGKFVSYDEPSQTFVVLVTSTKAEGFGGSAVGGKAPSDIKARQERTFAVKPEGSVLSRTVIKSSQGTGLDNSGTQEGFQKAIQAIPADRVLAFSIEKNADHERDASAPEYRIKTIVLKLTDEEIQRRFDELVEEP